MTADAVGGVWQYSVDLSQELTNRGYEVMLAVLGPPPSSGQRGQLASAIVLSSAEFKLEWMDHPWEDVTSSQKWLLALESQFRPDLIHLNSYALASAPWKVPVVCVAHSCVFSWWSAVHSCSPGPDWNEYEKRVSCGLRAADHVVAPSQFMAEAMVRHYGVSRGKTRVIPNFSVAPIAANKKKEPFLLAVGRMWDAAKNMSLLESTAFHLNWPLCVAGTDHTAAQDGPRSIRALGNLTHQEVLERMAVASIFVHPARYEPFGLAVLEAARARCCLVLADIPTMRELWDGAAVFIDPQNQERWIVELNRIIDDDRRREHLADLAFEHSARYSADAAMSLYIEAYEACLSTKRGDRGAAA